MDYLRVSVLLIFFQLTACVTSSSYKINRSFSLRYELKVTPDRVLLECEENHTDDGQQFYAFYVHILDNEKTVNTLMNTIRMYDNDCFERIKVLEKAIKASKVLFIGSVGDIFKPVVKRTDRVYDFPKHGKYFFNGRSLTFTYLMNETGFCYDAYTDLDKPCPSEDYPMMPFDANTAIKNH